MYILISVLRDVDFALDPGGLGPGREVDGVAEQAVTRHLLPNHSRHHVATVDPYRDLKTHNTLSMHFLY
jgi:hypothetical protein